MFLRPLVSLVRRAGRCRLPPAPPPYRTLAYMPPEQSASPVPQPPLPRAAEVASWLAVVAVLGGFLWMCVAPSQTDERVYGRVTVAFDASIGADRIEWRSDQLPKLREALGFASSTGPVFAEVTPGSADVVVRPFDSGPGCARGIGRYAVGTRVVEIDPVCAQGYLALQQAAVHELLHFYLVQRFNYRGHVCRTAGESGDCHPTILGDAVLNLTGPAADPGPGFDEAWTGGGVGEPRPSDLDLRLVRECQSRGRCVP